MAGPYHTKLPAVHQTTKSTYPPKAPAPAPDTKSSNAPVQFLHSITSTWTIAQSAYYRHEVIIKNTSQKPIADLMLLIEKLSGPLWGLSPTNVKNIYELPLWQKVLNPGAECIFVYIQGGPQAKLSVLSYH
ncbi:hypothetical protein SO802_012510 [Lithocarpus litseifolius]|uniref:Carbohydrate binding domain-containing protein n=1 Tax=Lithocarpus litseifolius TaxID=425828 RepID=A0AAW2D3S1_9ROSI